MAIPVRDPAEHDPEWRGRKTKPLLSDGAYRIVADTLHRQLRSHLKKDAPPTAIMNAAIAVVRALQVAASDKGKRDVMKRHDAPGGSHDMAAEMRKVWASGKYRYKNKCAEGEYAGLGISYDQARDALINAPAPISTHKGVKGKT